MAATKYNVDKGLNNYDRLIEQVKAENAKLKERVDDLEKELHEKAVSQVRTTGGNVSQYG